MSPMGTTIAGFELSVRDLERAETFYSTGLGLRVRAREDHGTFRETQFIGEGDTAALLLVSYRSADEPTGTHDDSTKVALSVDDVRVLFAQAVDAGAEAIAEPRHHEGSGVWFALLRDPDGHAVLLVQRRERS